MKKTPLLFQVEKSLGPLEFKVTRIIWKSGRVTVRDILDIMKKRQLVAYTTVMTVMDNLYKKRFLTRKKIQKSYYYSPTFNENSVISDSLIRVFSDLSKDYGKRKILFFAVNSILPPKISISYGTLLTLLLFIFIFTAFDLSQNLVLSGPLDYLNFLISEPSLFIKHMHLFIPAFLESVPLVNAFVPLVSLISVIILTKKILKLLKVTRLSL